MLKVYFFVPNLIGYLRVVLTLAAFYFILSQPYVTVTLYLTSGDVLDAVDGFTARYFNQCSLFGDFLDKLLDRCGRIGMVMGLCALYPQYLFAFQLFVCLEVAGPWANHYRCTLRPDSKMCINDLWLIRIYFQEPFLSLVILGQDICVAMCYLLYFSPGPTVSLAGSSCSLWVLLAWLGAPFFIYRQVVICGLLLVTSFSELARLHHQEDWNGIKAK